MPRFIEKDPKNNELYRKNMSRLNSADVGNVSVHPTKISMVNTEREKRSVDAENVKQQRIKQYNVTKE